MKGFQISINNEVIINLNSFFSNIILKKIDDSYLLLMYGGDDKKNRFDWERKILKEGDLINFKVLNLDFSTLPKTIVSENINDIKEAYEYLKLELENKGLI